MQTADRSLRSVFVGNIPYDATEERLRDIFSAVGPVLSFRIVFDRETGKPKGYGFCEYKDQETATSAIRNLNGHDLGGRQLRVDSASNERARDEPDQQQQQQLNQQQGQQAQGPPGGGGLSVDHSQGQLQHQIPQVPEPLVDAQTVINNVLCSLPPEQLFDLCRQLKSSLLINPNETRQLLVQNPQLSFAILQSLVMIKAIDAQTAMSTLHKQLVQPAPIQATTMPMMTPMMQPQVLQPFPYVAGPPPQGPPQTTLGQAPSGPQGPVSGPQQPQNQSPSQPGPMPMGPATTVDPRLASADPRLAAAVAAAGGDPRQLDQWLTADPRLATSGPPGPQVITNVTGAGGVPGDPRLASAGVVTSNSVPVSAADPRLARQQQSQQQTGGPQTQWPFAAM